MHMPQPVLFWQQNIPLVRLNGLIDQSKQGTFSTAVRANDSDPLGLVYAEGDIRQDFLRPVALGYLLKFNHVPIRCDR